MLEIFSALGGWCEEQLGKAWSIAVLIIILQMIVVGWSVIIIEWNRKHRPNLLSHRFPRGLARRFHKTVFIFRDGLLRWFRVNSEDRPSDGQEDRAPVLAEKEAQTKTETNDSRDLNPSDPILNERGHYKGPIRRLCGLSLPSIGFAFALSVTAINLTLLFLDNILGSLITGVSKSTVLFLIFISWCLAAFQKVAFWQLDSELLFYFREIDAKWKKPGLTHKILIFEALDRVRQLSGIISERCQSTGDDRISDVRRDEYSITDKEDDARIVLGVADTFVGNFFRLDKDPECYERIIENLFMDMGTRTLSPLARTLLNIGTRAQDGSEDWFPTDYAALVWKSSLALAQAPDSTLSATSLVDFEKFREHYEQTEHPQVCAKRIFIIDPMKFDWEDKLRDELIKLNEDGEDAKLLPRLNGETETMSHFEWVVRAHKRINWKVKFILLSDAEVIRARQVGADLPKYLDFLLVPAKNSWSVRFTCDMNVAKETRDYELKLLCCPLKVDYIRAPDAQPINDSQRFFNELWQDAEFAKDWLLSKVTAKNILTNPKYAELTERLT